MDSKEIENAAEDKPTTRRHSAEQRTEFLRQWEASGLSAEAFSKSRPFDAQSLYRWRMMEKSARRDSRSPGFREFKLAAPARPEAAAGPRVAIGSRSLEVSIVGAPIDERLCAFVKAISREVFNV